MKRIVTVIAAAGFLAASAAPALAGSGCGFYGHQTADHPQGPRERVAEGPQSYPTTATQTASSTPSETATTGGKTTTTEATSQ